VALRQQIKESADEERQEKLKSSMSFSVSEMNSFHSRVFDHFTQSDAAFDFYLASRRDNPTPRDASHHVANFIRIALEDRHGDYDGVDNMLVHAVAMMMVMSLRREHAALAQHPSAIFPHRKDWWEKGLEDYLTKHERCNFYVLLKTGERDYCAVRGRSAHKRHELASRTERLVGKQDIMSTRSFSTTDKESWLSRIKRKFEDIFKQASFGATGVDIRLDKLRREAYREHHALWSAMKSSKTCLGCIQSVPDHALRCEHSFCPLCIQELGTPSDSFECAFHIDCCPLCDPSEHGNPHLVQLKPRCAGVRILSLDGGGIRGIVELVLLKAIQKKLGLGVPLSEFFDLIVGTSTGEWRIPRCGERL